MIIKNVNIYKENKQFEAGTLYILDGVFVSGEEYESRTKEISFFEDRILDGNGAYAIPGLIDLHFHGCKGADFCDGTKEALDTIAEYEASVGVTTIAPATMTLPVEELKHILSVAAEYNEEQQKVYEDSIHASGNSNHPNTEELKRKLGAELIGINMEGPFISPVKKGAQDEANIIPCDIEICREFLDASKGLVKFIGIAPEESEHAEDFVREIKDQVHVALAHTNADYETAKKAFDAGADHAVHLYNAMPAYSHREPGVIGAVSDSEHVRAEMICDGIHLHPSTVRATFKMLGEERIILISDSMRATGMPDGYYTLGGLDVKVEGKRATLVSDGALAGSSTNLMDCMRTAVKEMKIPLEIAVACATSNPAKALGIEDRYGSIAEGKIADVVLLDRELELISVLKRGNVVS